MAATAVRCWRAPRWPDRRTFPRSRWRRTSAFPDLLRFLRRAGFSTFDRTAAHYGLGLTLGNAEVRLDELVAAYAAFARGGEWRRPTYLIDRSGERCGRAPRGWSRRERHSGSATSSPTPTLVPTSSAAAAAWSCRSRSRSRPGRRRRTTTTGRSDSPGSVTVGVWVGNFDRRPLRNSSGVTGAAPIFQAVMLAAHRRAGGTGGGACAARRRARAARRLRSLGRSRELLVPGAPTRVAASRAPVAAVQLASHGRRGAADECGRRSIGSGRGRRGVGGERPPPARGRPSRRHPRRQSRPVRTAAGRRRPFAWPTRRPARPI